MKRLLVIDSLNQFFRSYIVDPSLDLKGLPIGGVKGYLKILQKLVRETRPDTIVVVWDGQGGSTKRKQNNKEYKSGRKPMRLNRDVRNMTEDDEMQNKISQQLRLFEYLNLMPVIQLAVENVEADDVIAYIVRHYSKFKDWQKIIVSSDKDFYQLCDETTILFRPIQKEIVNKKTILENFQIHPNNFAIARAIDGDKSDNLKGVPRAGLTTLAKRFDILKSEKEVTFEDIYEICRENSGKIKLYDAILEHKDLVEQNYKLMQLYTSNIPFNRVEQIKNVFDNFVCETSKTEIMIMMAEDGFGEFNWNDLWAAFNRICWDDS